MLTPDLIIFGLNMPGGSGPARALMVVVVLVSPTTEWPCTKLTYGAIYQNATSLANFPSEVLGIGRACPRAMSFNNCMMNEESQRRRDGCDLSFLGARLFWIRCSWSDDHDCLYFTLWISGSKIRHSDQHSGSREQHEVVKRRIAGRQK